MITRLRLFCLTGLACVAALRAEAQQPPPAPAAAAPAVGTAPAATPTTPPAATPATPPAPATPLYQVEVLIFANTDFDPTEERFDHGMPRVEPVREQTLREPPPFDVSDAELGTLPPAGAADTDTASAPGITPPGRATGVNALGAVSGAATPVGSNTDAGAAAPPEPAFTFRILQPDELTLTPQARTIARLSGYRLLAHGGWVQAGLPQGQAVPFDLGLLGAANPSGTIEVYLSRFLHVQLDLSYVDPAQRTLTAASPANGDDLAEVDLAPRYRLAAERQTRSGDLQYFDHPAFGVLVKITQIQPTAASGSARPAA